MQSKLITKYTRFLTAHEQAELDPTGQAFDAAQKLLSRTETIYNTPSPNWNRDRVLDKYERVLSTAPLWYQEYEHENARKLKPQGGRPAWSEIEPGILESFTRGHRPRFTLLRNARTYLLRLIEQRVALYGYPQDVPHAYVTGTNAGIPTMSKKGTYFAETVGMSPYRHLLPAILGTRVQFGKARVIYQDSVCNVKYVNAVLAKVRYWLRTYIPEYFGAWTNPHYTIYPWMTEALDMNYVSVEGDYEHMDQGFSRPVAEFLLPVYELLLDPGEFRLISQYVMEVFQQPIYLGRYITVSEHNLLSGINPTNDWETIFSVINYLAAAQNSGIYPKRIVAIGDDASAIFACKYRNYLHEYYDALSMQSSDALMRLNHDKCRVGQPGIKFCKRYWHPGTPRINGVAPGAYSGYRTIWNTVWPERSADSWQHELVSSIQRLDNLVGAPTYASTVTLSLIHI